MENISMSNSVNYKNIKQLKYLFKRYATMRKMAEDGNYTALDICIDLDESMKYAMTPLQQQIVREYLIRSCMPLYKLEQELNLTRMKGVRELDRAIERASVFLTERRVIDNTEATRRVEDRAAKKRIFRNSLK